MKNELDKMLKDWFANHEKPEDELRSMAQHISGEALRKRRVISDKPDILVEIPVWRKLAYAAVVVILFGITLFTLSDLSYDACRSSGEIVELSQDITETQMQAGRVMFNEMERLFSDNFRWVAYSKGDSKLGIAPVHGGVAKDSVPVQYRLVLLVRQSGESDWQTSWSKDVLLRSEESAEIASDYGKNALNLWILPVDDKKVMVEAVFSMNLPVRITSSKSCLLDIGRPVEVLAGQDGNIEYRLFQTVTLLGNLT